MDSPNPGSDGSVIDVEPRQTRRTRGGGRPVASQSATPAATMTDGDDDTDGGAGTRAGPSDDDDGDDFQAVRYLLSAPWRDLLLKLPT